MGAVAGVVDTGGVYGALGAGAGASGAMGAYDGADAEGARAAGAIGTGAAGTYEGPLGAGGEDEGGGGNAPEVGTGDAGRCIWLGAGGGTGCAVEPGRRIGV